MGMTIEDCIKILIAKEKCMERETSGRDNDCNLHNCYECSLCYEQGTMGEQKEALKLAAETMRKYQKLQADYENRLKADMVAMLEDLDLQIDEFDSGCGWDGYIKKIDVHKLIQQKINALKAESEKQE